MIGVVPKRVQRGYFACRHNGVGKNGRTCHFVTFDEVDIEQANLDIASGDTLAHKLARARRGEDG